MSESYEEILEKVERLLPQDEKGEFVVFAHSVPVKEAVAKEFLSREQAEAWGLNEDDPSGYDTRGNPLECSDVVHDFLAHLAERMIELNERKQSEIKKFLDWLEAELQIEPDDRGHCGIEALIGKTKLKNFPGDYQKGEPHLEFDELWALLKRNEKRLGVTLSPDFRQRLSEFYQETLEKLLPLKEKLRATDELIDQIVYRLYGLSESERARIEGRDA